LPAYDYPGKEERGTGAGVLECGEHRRFLILVLQRAGEREKKMPKRRSSPHSKTPSPA
jgi:hypothetical protein